MGTMRKMEDRPAEEMAIAAVRTTSTTSELKLLAKTDSDCDPLQSKRDLFVPTSCHAGKQRHLDGVSGDVGLSNGSQPTVECEPVDDDGHLTPEPLEGDGPMDLSKRTADDEETDCSDATDEPLNLSRHGSASSAAATRWNSCPRLAHRPATSSSPTPTPTDLLQKRVRLEEMVSYIRRCSVVDAGVHRGSTTVEEDAVRAVKRSASCSHLETAAHRRKSATLPPSKRARSGLTSRTDDGPRDLSVANGGAYPVLRQQLLGIDCRQLGLLQSVTSRHLTEDDEVVEKKKKAPADGRDVDDGEFLRRQMRLLSTSGTAPARLPWTAYAYYTNLFQELQGAVGPLPLSLSVPQSDDRADSPLSGEDDADDDGGGSETTLTAAAAGGSSTVTTTSDGSASTGAMFRKRAPRALTGKHVKHGTGASPATLLTLRQKIEQKRIQQQQQLLQQHHHRLQLGGGVQRRTVAETHKSLKSTSTAAAATALKKKKVVS